jgi:hypothetical protein
MTGKGGMCLRLLSDFQGLLRSFFYLIYLGMVVCDDREQGRDCDSRWRTRPSDNYAMLDIMIGIELNLMYLIIQFNA